MRRWHIWLLFITMSGLLGCQSSTPNGLQPLDQSAFTLPEVVTSNSGNTVNTHATISITSGHKIKLAFYWQPQNADCSLQMTNQIAVSAQLEPQHGKLWAQPTQDFPRYAPDSPFYNCDKSRISGIDVYYIPDAGYVGVDDAGYTIYSTTGYKYIVDLTINIYPAALLTHLNATPPF